MEKIKILLIDDHPIIRDTLPSILNVQADMEVIETAESGTKALEKIRYISPDVIVLDISMPNMSGLEVVSSLKEKLPQAHIVIFTMHEKEDFVHRALSDGASAYVLKCSSSTELMNAIRVVHRGEYFLSSSLRTEVINSYLKLRGEEKEQESDYENLSTREQQVFRCMVEGKSTHEIGELLCLSPKTVGKHRISVMQKLNLRNPLDLVKYAVRAGLIDVDTWKD